MARSIAVEHHGLVAKDIDSDDLRLATVRPLVEDNPGLAERLADRFTAVVEAAAMSPGERDYVRGYAPVRVGSGETPGGLRVLQFQFGGSTTTMEWDGTERDAEEMVDGIAQNAADNAAGDYWIAGRGWEDWNKSQERPK